MRTEAPVSSQQFVRDRLCWLSYLLIGTCCYVSAGLGPLMPFLRAEMHLNYTVAALHLSAWALGVVIAGFAGDKIMRRFGTATSVMAAGAGVSLGTLILVCAHLPAITIAGSLFAGVSGSVMGQTLYTIMAQRFAAQRTVAITEATIAGSLAASLAPAFISACDRSGFGWRAALVLPILLMVVLLLSFRRSSTPLPQTSSRACATGKLPTQYWIYWTVILLSVACEWSLIFWSADFLEDIAKLSKADASAGVTAFLSAMLIGRIAGSRLARTMGISALLPGASLVAIAGFLVFWLSSWTPVNLLGLFVAGLGIANFYPLTLSAAISTAPEQAGQATSRVSAGTGAAILVAPLLLGLVADRTGIFAAYGIIALLLLMSAAMVLIANRFAARLGSSPHIPEMTSPGSLKKRQGTGGVLACEADGSDQAAVVASGTGAACLKAGRTPESLLSVEVCLEGESPECPGETASTWSQL